MLWNLMMIKTDPCYSGYSKFYSLYEFEDQNSLKTEGIIM